MVWVGVAQNWQGAQVIGVVVAETRKGCIEACIEQFLGPIDDDDAEHLLQVLLVHRRIDCDDFVDVESPIGVDLTIWETDVRT